MNYLFVILFLLLPLTTHAEIYKSVDANGNVTFTDKPSDNATIVVVPKGNVAPATSSEPLPADNANTENTPSTVNAIPLVNANTKKPYTKFMISSPTDQESIQNQPTLAVTIAVEPSLQEGDLIQIYVDGSPLGNAMHQTTFDLTVPYRGTHILSATLFDKGMQVLKQSSSITIFVHQAHIGSPAS